jgi:hypothetical protein
MPMEPLSNEDVRFGVALVAALLVLVGLAFLAVGLSGLIG